MCRFWGAAHPDAAAWSLALETQSRIFPGDTEIAKHPVRVVSRFSEERKRIWSSWSLENIVRAQNTAGAEGTCRR